MYLTTYLNVLLTTLHLGVASPFEPRTSHGSLSDQVVIDANNLASVFEYNMGCTDEEKATIIDRSFKEMEEVGGEVSRSKAFISTNFFVEKFAPDPTPKILEDYQEAYHNIAYIRPQMPYKLGTMTCNDNTPDCRDKSEGIVLAHTDPDNGDINFCNQFFSIAFPDCSTRVQQCKAYPGPRVLGDVQCRAVNLLHEITHIKGPFNRFVDEDTHTSDYARSVEDCAALTKSAPYKARLNAANYEWLAAGIYFSNGRCDIRKDILK